MTDHELPKTRSGAPRAFFGRRSGKKLHGGQQAVFDATLPELEIKLDGKLDPRTLFPDADRIIVEIGYGGGEHLALEAGRHPEIGYIGCEVFTGGIGKMVQAIAAQTSAIFACSPTMRSSCLSSCQMPRSTRSTCSIPIPGPRRAITSAALFRQRRSRNWPA